MKAIKLVGVMLVCCTMNALCADVDTIHVPSERPTDVFAELNEQVYRKVVVVKVGKLDAEPVEFTAHELVIYQDTANWKDSVGTVKVSMAYVHSICLPEPQRMCKGSALWLGAESAMIVAGLFGSTNTNAFDTPKMNGIDKADIVSTRMTVSDIVGKIYRAIRGTTPDRTLWVFDSVSQ